MTTRQVVSTSAKRRATPKGSSTYQFTEMVIYKTKLSNGKYHSATKHEIAKKQP